MSDKWSVENKNTVRAFKNRWQQTTTSIKKKKRKISSTKKFSDLLML
jgi:hypothetical protein